MSLFLLGFASTGFAPNQIAGLRFWYDASLISGLADGAAVATWADASGNANNASQAVAGLRPLYKVNILNGRPGVLFDGVDDYLDTPIAVPAITTIFIAYSGRTGATGSLLGDTDGAQGMLQRDGNVWSNVNSSSIVLSRALNSYKLLTLMFNYTADTYEARVGGSSAGTNATATTAGAGPLILGARNTGTEFLTGYLHEIALYNTALTAAQINTVEAYLASKWGFALS